MLLPMVKVQIIGTKRYRDQTIKLLHRRGVLQVESSGEEAHASPTPELPEEVVAQSQELAEVMARLDAVLSTLTRSAERVEKARQLYSELYDAWDIPELLASAKQGLEELSALIIQELALRREELEAKLVVLTRSKVPKEEKAAIQRELEDIARRLRELSVEWYERLAAWRAIAADKAREIEVRSRLQETGYTFTLTGWIPRRDLRELEEALGRETQGEVWLRELEVEAEEWEEAPVALDNPRPLKPFEFLVSFLALPRYGSLDPTPFIAVFLPLFIGAIVGDIAYGLVIAVGGIYVVRKFERGRALHDLGIVIALAGCWSIIWGFLFGEVLGTLGERMGLHPLLMDRAHAVMPLLALTIGIGVAHVILGLILGVWNGLRLHHRREIVEKLGMLLSLVGMFLLGGVFSGFLPGGLRTPVIALFLIGLVVLIASLGKMGILMGPLELLGTVGNMLSYLRIAAVGLSSVYLAQVANTIAENLGGRAGLPGLILGVLIAAFFHILNIALGFLSPTIQSLRLHYVEFFRQFYESGGKAFAPFKRIGVK